MEKTKNKFNRNNHVKQSTKAVKEANEELLFLQVLQKNNLEEIKKVRSYLNNLIHNKLILQKIIARLVE